MLPLLLVGSVIGAFLALWYLLGTWAGVLWTPRALWVAAALALLGALGFWVPWALDAILVGDAALVALIWLDATLAVRPIPTGLTVVRDPLPALSVALLCRWATPAR